MWSQQMVDARVAGVHTEDTITLAVQWRNRSTAPAAASDEPPAKKQKQEAASAAPFTGGTLGHAMYTSSWIAPKSVRCCKLMLQLTADRCH